MNWLFVKKCWERLIPIKYITTITSNKIKCYKALRFHSFSRKYIIIICILFISRICILFIIQYIHNIDISFIANDAYSLYKSYIEEVFEAVRRRFLVALAALLASLTEQYCFLVQEQVSLHWLEACQVLDLGVTFLVLGPNAERALHQQPAQLIQVPLETTDQQV